MTNNAATGGVRAGLFLLSSAIVLLEIVLTRLFSATMWYHFAFLAISVAMFGSTVGALVVYLRPQADNAVDPGVTMSNYSVLFGGAAIVAMLLHLVIPIVFNPSLTGLFVVLATLGALSAPFALAGVAVTLALTRFPANLGLLYAADLCGAALACALMPAVLSITDAPTTVFFAASMAAVAGVLFAPPESACRKRAKIVSILLIGFVVANTVLYRKGVTTIPVLWTKTRLVGPSLFERWNSISLVKVSGNPEQMLLPFGWGLSSQTPTVRLPWLYLRIDGDAGTPLLNLAGDAARAEHLKYDVTAVAHYLRQNARVLVIGVGGGRDIQTALAFHQASVTGVEINPACLEACTDVFADFVGNFHRDPRVKLYCDEARSYLARTPERYDLLQISLIDTWAATAAGAYVLSENALYTVEAWKLFLDRLTDHGVLSVSRWSHAVPVEIMRSLSLAQAALRARGVTDPRRHVMVVYNRPIATVLISPSPFTSEDRARLRETCDRLDFRIVLDEEQSDPPHLADLISRPDLGPAASLPFDLSPSTDDRPFFFQNLKLSAVLDPTSWTYGGQDFNAYSVLTVFGLLAFVLLLAGLVAAVPRLARGRSLDLGPMESISAFGLGTYFVFIGLGYMLIEVSQMQRLSILLGHPTYSMTVVLGTLLVASGTGSWIAGRLRQNARSLVLAGIVVVLGITGYLVPFVVALAEGWPTAWRVALAAAIVAPAGLLMGMPFTLGMSRALAARPESGPWLFALNGAASITASVLSIVLAMTAGISWAFWAGVVTYGVAFLASSCLL